MQKRRPSGPFGSDSNDEFGIGVSASFFLQIEAIENLGSWAGVALGKGEVDDHPRPHLKIRPHSKIF